jgi:secretion/DNA translocation related CpaE-like protein
VALLSSSPVLTEQVTRLSLAAGVEVAVPVTPDEQHRAWRTCPLVLVGADAAVGLTPPPTRRAGVLLLDERDDEAALRLAVAVGAERVVSLPADAPWLVDRLGDAVDGGRAGAVVGLLGVRGGVGTTVLAAALGVTAVAAGLRCVLVDADPLGDLPLVLDVADEPGVRWHDLAAAAGRLPAGDLGAALPSRDGVRVLGGRGESAVAVPAGSVDAVLLALARGHDLVVVDLPRCPAPCAAPRVVPSAAHSAAAAQARCTVLLLVVPCDRLGVAAAQRLLAALPGDAADVRMVARVVRGGIDPHEAAAELRLPVAARVRTDRRVGADATLGVVRARSSLTRACRRLLGDLADRVPA